jgi:hypothetical protein
MAIEWGFLILLAVGAAVADLQTVYIILVVAIGWILVVLVELLSWRARPRYAVVAEAEHPPPPVERVLESVPAPVDEAPRVIPPPAPSPPPEAETAVVWAESDKAAAGEPQARKPEAGEPEQPAPALDPADPFAPAPERENLRSEEPKSGFKLEPLKPRPSRKYRWFGPYLPRGDEPAGGKGA